jgi:hypothetical protein
MDIFTRPSITKKRKKILFMLEGFDKIIEERIREAQKKGNFDNLKGSGKPIVYENDSHVPEDLRMAYKLLKNANFIPPEIELRKNIKQAEDLLAGMEETPEKYRILKKINFMIMKLNSMRDTSIIFEMPQRYQSKLEKRLEPEESSVALPVCSD